MSVKFGDIISKYDGSEDFAEWIEKVELVASLQNVKSLQKFFRYFLLVAHLVVINLWTIM